MSGKLTILALVALASGLIAAGCGGDDEEDTTTTTSVEETTTAAEGATGPAEVSPERATLIEAADAICQAGDDEIDAEAEKVFGDSNQEPSAADQESFVAETVIPSIQDQLDQLSELEAPEEDAAEFQAIIDEAQSALDELAEDPSAFVSGDQDPFAEVNQRAREFGLTACGG